MSVEGAGQARCVLHPLQAASGTCGRCGNFVCEACTDFGKSPLCPTCRAKVGDGSFPLAREGWTFDALWNLVWARFQQEWVMLSVSALLIMGATMITSAVTQAFQMVGTALFDKEPGKLAIVVGGGVLLGQALNLFIQGLMQLGMYRICMDVLEGRTVDLGRFLQEARHVGRYVVLMLIIIALFALPALVLFGGAGGVGAYLAHGEHGDQAAGLVFAAMGLGMVVFVPFAIYFGIPLYLAVPELVANDQAGAWQVIRNCYAVAKDQRLAIFGVGLVVGLLVFAGMLACCIGIIPAVALGQLLITALYCTLRNGTVDGAVPPGWPEGRR
jgi:hypothetical protein